MVVRSLLTVLGYQADDKALNRYANALKKVLNFVKIAAVATAALGGAVLKLAGDMEQTEIAFETMLGSGEKADALIKEITDFAAKTPFELSGLIQSSKQLLAFKFGAEEIIPTMRNLGNIAAGVGRDKLPTLVRALGKIRVKGKATMEELNMLLEAGVPILDQLAANYGVTSEELFKMISKGKVAYDDVNKALADLSTGNGMFANLMEKQSKSFLGIISNIGDFFTNLGIAIGKDILPAAKELAKYFLKFLETNKDIIKENIVKFLKSVMYGIAFVIIFIKNLIDRMGGLEVIGKVIGNIFNIITDIFISFMKIIKRIIVLIRNFIEKMGGLEAIGKVIGKVFNFIIVIIKNLIERMSKIFDFVIFFIEDLVEIMGGWEAIGKTIKEIFNFISGILVFFVKTIGGIFDVAGGVFAFVMEIILQIIKFLWPFRFVILGIVAAIQAWAIIQAILNAIMLANPVSLMIVAIIILITLISLLVQNWEKVKKVLVEGWKNIVNFLSKLWNGLVQTLVNTWSGIVNFFTNLWNEITSKSSSMQSSIISGFSKVWNDIVKNFQKAWQKITNSIGNIQKIIVDNISSAWFGITKFFSDLWENIVNGFIIAWKAIIKIMEIPGKIIEWLKKVWGDLGVFFSDLWGGIIEGIKKAWDGLISGLKELWDNFMNFIQPLIDSISGVFKFFFGGPSPEVATAGGTATAIGSRSSTTTVNSTVNMTVPPGTPEEVAQSVKIQSRKAVEEAWKSILKEGNVNNPGGGL